MIKAYFKPAGEGFDIVHVKALGSPKLVVGQDSATALIKKEIYGNLMSKFLLANQVMDFWFFPCLAYQLVELPLLGL